MPKTLDKPKQSTEFIDSVKDTITTDKVFVRCVAGTYPLEWPKGTVSDADLMQKGNALVRVNEKLVRNIETSTMDEFGKGAASEGGMWLDLMDDSHPIESDKDFLARIEDYLAHSRDPRISQFKIAVLRSNPYKLPFGMWDTAKPASIYTIVSEMLGDDAAANTKMLTEFAQYELNRDYDGDGPRQEVLDALEILAQSTGDESSDDAPEDES